jgi:hypothetical protein
MPDNSQSKTGGKMAARTDSEVKAMIASMEKLRPKVRPFSGFGDDLLAQFDVALGVLRESITEDQLNDIVDPEQNGVGQNALDWMNGEDVEFPPDTDWPLRK